MCEWQRRWPDRVTLDSSWWAGQFVTANFIFDSSICVWYCCCRCRAHKLIISHNNHFNFECNAFHNNNIMNLVWSPLSLLRQSMSGNGKQQQQQQHVVVATPGNDHLNAHRNRNAHSVHFEARTHFHGDIGMHWAHSMVFHRYLSSSRPDV